MAKTKCDVCDRNFKNEEALVMHNKSKHNTNASGFGSKISSTGKKKTPWGYFIAGLILILIIYFSYNAIAGPGKYDSFAQCVTDSGAKFYGAFWCPHCSTQKQAFGKSIKYINYIECSTPDKQGQTQPCIDVGIQSYPTWIFGDESRTGALDLAGISRITGCALP